MLVIVFMEMVDTQVVSAVSVVLKEVKVEEISFDRSTLSIITQLLSVSFPVQGNFSSQN